MVQITVLTSDRFNEPGSLVAAAILIRTLECIDHVADAAGRFDERLTADRQHPLELAAEADAVLICSGIKTVRPQSMRASRIVLCPSRHLVGAQCSGTLLLARL